MKIIKDSAIYVVGEIFAKAIPFLLLPYLSRKLGADGFGELSYYQTYLALFVIVIGLSQDGAVARYYYVYGGRALDLIVNAGYAYSVAMGVCLLVLFYVLHLPILMYLVVVAVFQSCFAVQLAVRQCQKRAYDYARLQILSGVLGAGLTVVLFETIGKNLVFLRFLAILLAQMMVVFLGYVWFKKHRVKKKFAITHYKLALFYMIGFGSPLLFHHFSLFIRGQADKLIIYHQFTPKDLGVYAMAGTLVSAFGVCVMAINKATIPYYFESIKSGAINFKTIKKWSYLALMMTPIPAVVAFFLPESLFLWLLGDKFVGIGYYFALFLFNLGLSVPYLILVNYLFYYGKNSKIALCSVITTGIYLGLFLFFLNMGMAYLPFASIISSFIVLPILVFFAKSLVR